MKKYKMLILLLFVIIINFLFNWFKLEINTYEPFLGFFIGMLCYVSFIYIFIFLIRKFIDRENLLLNGICFGILIIYLIFKFFFPFVFVKCKLEMKFYENDRIEIVDKIKSGEIPSNSKDTIYLSESYNYIAAGGIVSVYMNNLSGIVIGFNVYSGGVFASDIEIIYSSLGIDGVNKINGIKDIKELKDGWYYVIVR